MEATIKTKKAKTETFVIRVDSDMKQAIGNLATSSEREVSDYLRLVLKKTIESSVTV